MLPRLEIGRACVVIRDLARQVEAERDELAAVPADVRRRLCSRPRRRSAGRRYEIAVAVEAGTTTTRTAAPRPACVTSSTSSRTWTKRRLLRRDWRDAALTRVTGRRVEGADGLAIDARRRIRIERRAAQRVERRHRAVHVDRRGAVERQIDVFFVFVLPEQPAVPPQRRRQRLRRARAPALRQVRITANDIVKISAALMSAKPVLYLIDGSSQMYRAYHAPIRTAEGGAASQRAGHADQRRLHLRHDAAQAAQRAPAGVHRRVVRSAGPHVPRRSRRRLQGQPRADAGRARRADPAGARARARRSACRSSPPSATKPTM